ncbi:hypothetical protein vBAmePPT11V19_00054 [Alteromonas phage vB_AmeP_PT11-V19]|nr:hypothetical protein vBAmePPT11V19_00054 [Alteromonas phage vB_AmeP_PT11-V19]
MKLEKFKKTALQLIAKGDTEKLRLAMLLDEANQEIDWKATNYGTWRKFCKECVPLPYTEIYRLIAAVRKSSPWFNSVELSYVVKAIGWTRFEIGTQHCSKTEVAVSDFVAWYKDVNVDERVTAAKPDDGLISFNFQLGKAEAEILTTLLLERGMRISNSSRVNASSAMAKLVDEVRKSS